VWDQGAGGFARSSGLRDLKISTTLVSLLAAPSLLGRYRLFRLPFKLS